MDPIGEKTYYIYDLKGDTQPHQIDFKESHFVLRNEQVLQRYREIKRYCPYDERCKEYFDIYYQPDRVLYFTLNRVELFTRTLLNEYPLLKTIIDRHIKHSNYLLNDAGFSYICEKFGQRKKEEYLCLCDPPRELRTKLYDYQRDNLQWMLDNEQVGVQIDFTEHKFCRLDDGRIYDYYVDEIYTDDQLVFRQRKCVRGGILMDDVGIGKTLQAIALILANPMETLIVVPNHLVHHWHEQVKLHLSPADINGFYALVRITSFDCLRSSVLDYHFQRVIVDEIHEIFCNNAMIEALNSCQATHRWGLTATPWVRADSLYHIFSFLTGFRFSYQGAVRMTRYHPYYDKLFRRNAKHQIQREVHLPPIHLYNVLIQFNEAERNLYEIEKSTNEHCHVDFLRELCGCIDMDTEFYSSQVILNHFESAYSRENLVLANYQESIDLLSSSLIDQGANSLTASSEELEQNLCYYKTLHARQQIIVEARRKATERYKDGLQKIENIINSDSKEECIICFDMIKERIAYYKCGHYFCHECVTFIRQQTQNKKCPYCRVETLDSELYILTKRRDNQKYNSKINRMLEVICSRPSEERFIIYTQFDKVLNLLANVFGREKKAFQIYQANVPVCESTSILLLSNVHTASGIELTGYNNIIIFEPFHDEKSLKFVEQQMIGRIYRIGQTRETNVYRLIVRNSIESEIYSISC